MTESQPIERIARSEPPGGSGEVLRQALGPLQDALHALHEMGAVSASTRPGRVEGFPVTEVAFNATDPIAHLTEADIRRSMGDPLTNKDKGAAVRELNHETNGMVPPGKEAEGLRAANEALVSGDMHKFGEAFKGLSLEERRHVADAMNQAFAKRGDSTRVNIDADGNVIASNGKDGEQTTAVRINPDTGKTETVTGKRDGNEFVVTGVSTEKPNDYFAAISENAAWVMQPQIPLHNADATSRPM